MKTTTPICDFVKRYIESGDTRLHMPGHKGMPILGFETYDITEIYGADSLYEADGIIKESEACASLLFGCPTFYSTEGSSQCIRAMLYLANLTCGEKMKIAAGRNAHKVFLSAAALLDFDIDWLMPEGGSYLSCPVTAEDVEEYLKKTSRLPNVVYLTSPDYLGNTLDIGEIAEACHKHGVMLLIDGAHGAYLKFLDQSCHPMDLGADMCASSAHKTLPVLTGGAYLHISPALSEISGRAKDALMMFGSTSPSYLVLQSLDAVNPYLADHESRLSDYIPYADALRHRLMKHGYSLAGDEPMKITVCPKSYGYTGTELGIILKDAGMICEFADPDHTVIMLTPDISPTDLTRIGDLLASLPRRDAIEEAPPKFVLPRRVMSVRDAALSPAENISIDKAAGRILASTGVGCPPAVPIAVCGEVIDDCTIECFRYYGIERCTVIK